MNKQNRRTFLQGSAVALAAGLGPGRAVLMGGDKAEAWTPTFGSAGDAQKAFGNEGKKALRLGLIIGIGNDPDAALANGHELGFPACQVYVTEFTAGLVERVGKECRSRWSPYH